MQDKLSVLRPDFYYHVFNHSIDGVPIFLSDANFRFFLTGYKKYVLPVVDVFCYCLMTNHFHFLIRIKQETEIRKVFFERRTGKIPADKQSFYQPDETELSNFVSRQFGHWFNSYAQAFNKQQGRRGSLFERPFKRKVVTDEYYLKKLVLYIHFNPVEAGLAKWVGDYPYSSYQAIVTNKNTTLQFQFQEVIGWFGDLENFKTCHKHPPELSGIR